MGRQPLKSVEDKVQIVLARLRGVGGRCGPFRAGLWARWRPVGGRRCAPPER